MQTTTNDTKQLSAIERALAAAKARKAAKVAAGIITEPLPDADVTVEKKTKKAAADDDSRDVARQKRDAERVDRLNAKAEKAKAEEAAKAAKKAEREAKKVAKAAEKAAAVTDKKPSHMKKVDKARAKCPKLTSEAEVFFGDVTANLTAQQVDALAQHLLVHVRATRTIRATQTAQLPLGAKVRITGGETKFIGMVGEVVHSQKLRAKVAVDGIANPVYIYTGEAEVVNEEATVVVA